MCEEKKKQTQQRKQTTPPAPNLYSCHPSNVVVPGVDTLNSVYIELSTLH